MQLYHGSGKRGRKSFLQVHSIENCERECTVTDPCVAYTFVPMVHRCDLKASSDATSLEDVGGSVVSGRLDGERPPPPEPQEKIINSTVCLPCLPSELFHWSGVITFMSEGKPEMFKISLRMQH